MTYLHVKKIGDKRYYTLRKSIRKGEKILKKDICNLGTEIGKINLKNLEKKYKIKNSHNTIKKSLELNYYFEESKKQRLKKEEYFNKEQLIQRNAVLMHFRKKFKKLDNSSKKEILKNFHVNFIVENISIENNFINLKEAEILLKENLVPKNRSLTDVYRIINTKKILEFLEDKKPPINLNLIEKMSDLLMKNICWAKGCRSSEIRIVGNSFKPSSAKNVRTDLKELLKWFFQQKNKIHPLALIILFHHKFEKIHPFLAGNGEIGRILMNYMLSSFNYPPIIIPKKSKEEYLKTMNKAYPCLKKDLLNTDMKYYKPLIDFMQKQFVKTYWNYFLV